MKIYLPAILAIFTLSMSVNANAWSIDEIYQKIENMRNKINASAPWQKSNLGMDNSYNSSGTSMSGNYQADAYGLGTNADQYGRSFNWQYRDGSTVSPIFNNNVKPDVYGLGVGMDQFGRPVRRKY